MNTRQHLDQPDHLDQSDHLDHLDHPDHPDQPDRRPRAVARRRVGMAAIVADTLRGVRGHRRRIVPTFVAVLLGVAFTAGTLIMTDTLRSAFSSMHTDNNAGIDIAVRAAASFGTGASAERSRVSDGLTSELAAIDGVHAAAGRTRGWAQLSGADGTLLGNVASGVDPTGENWIADPQLNPWVVTEGAPPSGANQVVIDRTAATELGLVAGDPVDVVALGGVHDMTVSGIATFGEADSRFGTVTVLFDEPTAQTLLGEPGRHDGILVRVDADASIDVVAERIRQTLGGNGTEVVTGAQLADEAHAVHMQDWAFFDTLMIGFAVIALVVGGFIIFNTFSITIAQRTSEFAMLRAIGAGRGQIFGSVLVESLAVGALASALGLAGGLGVSDALYRLFAAVGIDLPSSGLVVDGTSLAVAFGAGLSMTALSALVPAARAMRVRPIAAMREASVERSSISRRRIAAGVVVVGAGVAAVGVGLAGESLAVVGLGGLALFIGATALGPSLVHPFARIVGSTISRLRGMPGTLARDNVTRNPRRTAVTASALTIGVGLVGFITVVAASIKESIHDMVGTGVRAEVVVESGSFGYGGLDRSLATELRTLPEVAAVSGVSLSSAQIDGEVMGIAGVDSSEVEAVLDFGRVEGSLAGADGSGLGLEGIAVNEDLAAERGWSVGSSIDAVFADGVERTLVVAAIVEDPHIGLEPMVDAVLLVDAGQSTFDLQAFVALADGVPLDVGLAAVADVTRDVPQAEVLNRVQFSEYRAALVDPLLGVVYALLALAVLIAALGIMNTLALSILERTRELGVLRAIGATKAQVRAAVRWESAMIAGFGTALGLTIGTGLGWAIVRSLETEGIRTFVLPAGSLGVIAALAARLDVLDALRS